ncbi:MAG: SMP-30/gluconolactonase/LRE family protein [Chitinophagales bacterium]
MNKFLFLFFAGLLLCLSAAFAQHRTIGKIIRIDPRFDDLIGKDASLEILADSFAWSEGPAWVKAGNYLLFSDIPNNSIFKWSESEGLSLFLKPSGYTGRLPYSKEPGSNGLIINHDGQLVACEHGDRRISAMPLALGGKRTLADNYQGKKLNSPNDIVQRSNGDYYFTDPYYGLPKREKDSLETGVTGVYRISKNGTVTLLISNLLPNGLAFSPDEKILYVGQSDPNKPIIMSYPVLADGNLGQGKIFFDESPYIKQGLQGVPDGMKIDKKGNIFTTGPGGILVIDPSGKILGRIETTQPTANCTWGDDGSTLYITANMYLCRVRTLTKGVGF